MPKLPHPAVTLFIALVAVICLCLVLFTGASTRTRVVYVSVPGPTVTVTEEPDVEQNYDDQSCAVYAETHDPADCGM